MIEHDMRHAKRTANELGTKNPIPSERKEGHIDIVGWCFTSVVRLKTSCCYFVVYSHSHSDNELKEQFNLQHSKREEEGILTGQEPLVPALYFLNLNFLVTAIFLSLIHI